MRQLLIYLLVALPLVSPAISYAGVGFEFEKAFVPPQLDGDIVKVAFCHVDKDSTAEVAVATTRQIVVYNYQTDSVIRRYDITTPVLDLVFADVNRDRIPDVVYTFHRSTPERQFVVVGLDGAGTRADTLVFSLPSSGCTSTGGTIGAFDLNKDGFKELLVSADTARTDALISTTFGQTRLYYSFPDSLVWKEITPAITSATYLPYGVKQPGVWLDMHTCTTSPTLPPDNQTGCRYLLPDGQTREIDFSLDPLCGNRPTTPWSTDHHPEAFRSTGVYSPVTELISVTKRQYSCGQEHDTSTVRTMNSFFLYKPEFAEKAWSNRIVKDYSDFIMSPELPDFVCAFEVGYNALTMFRLSDGSFRSRLEQVPTGQLRWWDYPVNDVPRLITVNGQEVAIYHLRATSDSPDDGRNDLLPASFVLGQPFPSPDANGLTLPVFVPRPGHLTVEVYDRKGQRLQVLADQETNQGRVDLLLDGSKIPSGPYIIRATEGKTIVSLNALLLR